MSNVRCVVARVFDGLLSCARVKDYVLPDEICIEEYLDSYDYAELQLFCDENIKAWIRLQIIERLCEWWDRIRHDGYIFKPQVDTDEKLQKVIFRWWESKFLDFYIQVSTVQTWNATDIIQWLLDQFSSYWLCASVFVEWNPDISVDISKCETLFDVINEISQDLWLHWTVKPQKKQDWTACLAICLVSCIGEDRTTTENCYRVRYDGKYTQTSTVNKIVAYSWWSQVTTVIWSSWWLTSEISSWWDVKWVKCIEFDEWLTQEQLDIETKKEFEKCLWVDITLEIWVDKNIDVRIWDKIKVVIDNYYENVNWEYSVTVIRTTVKYIWNERETRATVSNASNFLTREKILKNLFQ